MAAGACLQPARALDVSAPELVLRSEDHGYTYAYAPTILRTGRGYEMIFCSNPGVPGPIDWLRWSSSEDGLSWEPPRVLVTVSAPATERAACDPSLVRYAAPTDEGRYYYLFYSGAPENVQTAMFVARARRLSGPYEKWTGERWEIDAPEPKPIILPVKPRRDGTNFYGAGEQSVVVRDGTLWSWFNDDTTCDDAPCNRLFLSRSQDPTNWPERIATNIEGLGSVDVKYDAGLGEFLLYGIADPHSAASRLVRRRSTDGIAWSEPETLAAAGTFPLFAHNVGISGDDQGHVQRGEVLVAFGATDPANIACGLCWGRWDLYGMFLKN